MSYISVEGYLRVLDQENKPVFAQKNVIVLGVKHLFARMFANMGKTTDEVRWGVWGLALGEGDPAWATVPPADNTVFQLVDTQHVRKALSKVQYVNKIPDPLGGPDLIVPSTTWTNMVEFQTQINATTDGLIKPDTSIKVIREMGLIGGGSKSANTDPKTKAFWDETNNNVPDSMSLINYKTLPSLIFPPDVTFLISWTLSF
jgi:hypothetical protein